MLFTCIYVPSVPLIPQYEVDWIISVQAVYMCLLLFCCVRLFIYMYNCVLVLMRIAACYICL